MKATTAVCHLASSIDDDVSEIEICVDKPRLIEMICISHRDHKTTKRHLKITEKGKVALL
jgi:hypothetical protein